MKILYQMVDDSFLISKIERAKNNVSLTSPGVSMAVAKALDDAVKRLGRNVHLLIDASLESFKHGFNDPHAIALLQECIRNHNLDMFRCEDGIRIGVLSVDDEEPFFFLSESVMLEKLKENYYNSALTDETQQGFLIGETSLSDIQVPSAEQIMEIRTPKTKEEQLQAENIELKQKVEELQEEIREIEKEKGKLPIQKNLKFVDIEVSNYKLNTLKIKVPGKFLAEQKDVNARFDSRYLILDSNENVDEKIQITINGKKRAYSISNFYREVKNLRSNYTAIVGEWNRSILSTKIEEFKSECDRLVELSNCIKEAYAERIKKEIENRLKELFLSLKPLIEVQYKASTQSPAKCSDEVLFAYFRNEMERESEKAKMFFNPQIKCVFKEISREDAESNRFREALRKSLGAPSDFLYKNLSKDKTFLYYDEELLRVSERGKRSVVIISNQLNYPSDQWELLRGIQRFWKRIIEFIPEERKKELEFNLNLIFLSLNEEMKIRIDNLSYLDLLDLDVVESGEMGPMAKLYINSIPLHQEQWSFFPLLYPDQPTNLKPREFAQSVLDELIDDLEHFARCYSTTDIRST